MRPSIRRRFGGSDGRSDKYRTSVLVEFDKTVQNARQVISNDADIFAKHIVGDLGEVQARVFAEL